MKSEKLKQKEIKELNTRFAMLCKYYRSKNNLSSLQMGEKLECSKSMVEAYESPSDIRGPAKSYSMLRRMAAAFDMSTTGLIHVLEGKENEEMESSELNKELTGRIEKLSTKAVSNLLFLLDAEKDKVEQSLEIAGRLSSQKNNVLDKINTLLSLPLSISKSAFALIETLAQIGNKKS